MNYEKAYKEALERAREVYHKTNVVQKGLLENIFPELKESEDERIRRELKRAIAVALDYSYFDKETADNCIAWLEKQGKQDTMETQSEEFDDNIITSDDEILQAISIGLTDIIEDFGWSDFGGLPIEENQSWLEMQDEQKPILYKNDISHIDSLLKRLEGLCRNEFERTRYAISEDEEWLKSLKKKIFTLFSKFEQCKQKEPKFKGGDWIVWQDKCYKVNYNGCGYELIDQNGLSTTLEYGTIDEGAHLWTINDVEEGDVLADSDGGIFIYAGSTGSYAQFYVALGRHGDLYTPTDTGNWDEKNKVYPATEKQRDTLFAKMRESGYEWDDENKELKKIETKGGEE